MQEEDHAEEDDEPMKDVDEDHEGDYVKEAAAGSGIDVEASNGSGPPAKKAKLSK